MKKKILIYAHYYAPDVASTGQIVQDIAEGISNEFDVTVICVVPSYTGVIEDRYKPQNYYFEELNGVSIIRVRVPEFSKSSKFSRIKNILVYFIRALIASYKAGKQDYVFSISQPPILGGLLGVLGKWMKSAKYIYNVQDFNPEQVMAVGYSKSPIILKMAMLLDKFSCNNSELVITVGRDLVETLRTRFHNKNVPKHVMINNWIDEKNIYPLDCHDTGVINFKKKYGLEDKFIIMYSGNIGLYYDLENLIKVIRDFEPGTISSDGREVAFTFVGNGTMLVKLKKYVEENKMLNVFFIPYQPKSELIYSLNAADVHWCINAKGIKGISCPSKAYGIWAVRKPMIAVLEPETEIRCIIEDTKCGLCNNPGDYASIKKDLEWFIDNASSIEVENMARRGYDNMLEKYRKDIGIEKYQKAILGCF